MILRGIGEVLRRRCSSLLRGEKNFLVGMMEQWIRNGEIEPLDLFITHMVKAEKGKRRVQSPLEVNGSK